MIKLAKGYHYLYEFIQLHDRSKKRLKGVYELRYDAETRSITIHQIIKYDYKTDDWFYKFDIGRDKEEIALQEEGAAYETFSSELKKLAIAKPLVGEHVTRPFYGRVREG